MINKFQSWYVNWSSSYCKQWKYKTRGTLKIFTFVPFYVIQFQSFGLYYSDTFGYTCNNVDMILVSYVVSNT